MNISFVLAVYNKLNLTKDCYRLLREVYPDAPLVISSGGSSDGTKEWLESLDDENLSYIHDDDRLTFSETYNAGIDLVDTDNNILGEEGQYVEVKANPYQYPSFLSEFFKVDSTDENYGKIFERIFSLWHVVHIPLVYLLVGTAIWHVIAVHMY